ncbi:hypothetical protein AJ80_00979 [Polytolypa hystricis UAMH7299]|uniref:Iron-sulfur assembly protein 1 n=1 Tax=Polytolypa hystricis (strain UAMH7299) TaxID=1447883 RepID=A0A2B7Z206_POLH7|nr:hypothetical protein AJ80_00979 [Polytolypa hystricis UAMH7299]
MSLSHAVRTSVTSSNMARSVARRSSLCQCAQAARFFSSSRPRYHSSKRELQTATAYRPYTLTESFPPPRNAGIPDTSIAGGVPETSKAWPSKSETSPEQFKTDAFDNKSRISLPEGEAQKSRPVTPAPTPKPSSSSAQAPAKPRKSRLRARKATMTITPAALSKLKLLVSQPDPQMIRVGVKNRGCSGLSYNLEYVEKPAAFDEVVEQDGVKVLVDSKALFSIIGSEMDWQEDKLSSRFVFKNPNIKDQCGCGESFMV